jgi:hypothetical protein
MKPLRVLVLIGCIGCIVTAAETAPSTTVTDVRHSIEYTDADTRTVLREIADLYDFPLIIPESLQGRATIKLRDVRWDQVLKKILEPIGYTYVLEGEVVVVELIKKNDDPKEMLSAEMLSTFSRLQTGFLKEMLRDKELVEAMADFHWNLYSALLRKGFSEDQAILLVSSAEIIPTGPQ